MDSRGGASSKILGGQKELAGAGRMWERDAHPAAGSGVTLPENLKIFDGQNPSFWSVLGKKM